MIFSQPRSVGIILSLIMVFSVAHAATAAHYQRPYGPRAPWNIPVTGLPRHPQSSIYASRLYNHATAARPGNFNLTFDGYTYPVYRTSDATGMYPVRTRWASNINGTTIPWNPGWKPATGTDGQVIILDSASGREWNLFQVSFDGSAIAATNGNLVQAGEEAGDGKNPGNYWTKENGFKPSRGCGIQYFAMLVVPEEIEQGVIPHALSMPIINTDGDLFVPPATKLEHPDNPSNGIPEGMRFAIEVTDAQIESWIASLPAALPDKTKIAARIIAVALRDYGWFITDTSGGAHFQFEDRASAGAKWDALGLANVSIGGKEYPRDLLDGLITEQNIYALVPSDQYPATSTGYGPERAKPQCVPNVGIFVNSRGLTLRLPSIYSGKTVVVDAYDMLGTLIWRGTTVAGRHDAFFALPDPARGASLALRMRILVVTANNRSSVHRCDVFLAGGRS